MNALYTIMMCTYDRYCSRLITVASKGSAHKVPEPYAAHGGVPPPAQPELHSAKSHHQHPTLPYNVPRSQGTHPIQSELELQAGGTLVLHLNLAFSLGFGTGIRPPRLPRCDFRHSPPTPPLLSPRFLHVPSCSSCSCPKP